MRFIIQSTPEEANLFWTFNLHKSNAPGAGEVKRKSAERNQRRSQKREVKGEKSAKKSQKREVRWLSGLEEPFGSFGECTWFNNCCTKLGRPSVHLKRYCALMMLFSLSFSYNLFKKYFNLIYLKFI